MKARPRHRIRAVSVPSGTVGKPRSPVSDDLSLAGSASKQVSRASQPTILHLGTFVPDTKSAQNRPKSQSSFGYFAPLRSLIAMASLVPSTLNPGKFRVFANSSNCPARGTNSLALYPSSPNGGTTAILSAASTRSNDFNDRHNLTPFHSRLCLLGGSIDPALVPS